MSKALLFAGQAAQFVGMGKLLFDSSAKARQLLEEANDALGFNLGAVMFEGPEQKLTETSITQPAVFVHSMMVLNHYKDQLEDITAAAGHSLGEISALVAAGVIDYSQGLQLVKVRSTAMQAACNQIPGTMAAILGMESDDVISEICDKVDGIVIPANFNCPGQVVISGERDAVLAVAELCKAAGAKRAIEIAVGGAFHSPLMQPALDTFRHAVEAVPFKDATLDVYQNVDARAYRQSEDLKRNLIAQLTSSVLWMHTIQHMQMAGIHQFIELGGKGKILAAMVKKIYREAEVVVWEEN